MNYTEFEQAVSEAENTLRRADNMADKLAKLMVGRLRRVYGYNILKDLKKELTSFNAHTGEWKP